MLKEDLWYAIGFFTADGSLGEERSGTPSLSFMNSDRQIIEDLKRALSIPSPVREQIIQHGAYRSCFSVKYSNLKFAKPFLDAGLVRRKSYDLGPMKLEKGYEGHFLRGYCDGDGCISLRYDGGVQLTFAGGSRDFMIWLQKLLGDYGRFGFYERNRKDRVGHWYQVMASGRNAIPFLKATYGLPGLVMQRKSVLASRFI